MGRLAPTHSRLSFNDLCKEAFASGLHPWEFYEYTLYEYLLRREGMQLRRRRELQEDYRHVQMLAYYSILPWLPQAARKKPIDEIVPNLYEERKSGDAKQRYKNLFEQYRQAGLINGGQRNQNNDRG